jgi:uncharacterized protein YjiS (DUF1127 family)
MAHITLNEGNLTERGANRGFFARIRESLAKYREYRRTIAELEALSDTDLRDLGLSRLSIRQIAYESVYGR